MESYESRVPIGEFKFPMDRMTQKSGPIAMNYEGLLQHLQTKPYWYIARIYKNFNGQLDMHIRWSYAESVHHYVLEFDPLFVEIGDDYELWPTPRDWYLAKAAIRTETSWTLAEYEAMGDYPAAMNDGGNSDVPIEADFPMDTMTHTSAIPAAMPAATEEGGTVFLCKGLFLFFFHFPPARSPLFHFLLFRLFPFLKFLSLSYLVSNFKFSILLLLSRFSTNAFWNLSNCFHQYFIFETLSSSYSCFKKKPFFSIVSFSFCCGLNFQ